MPASETVDSLLFCRQGDGGQWILRHVSLLLGRHRRHLAGCAHLLREQHGRCRSGAKVVHLVVLDRRVGRDALADGEGVRQPRGHSERAEAPKARHIDELAVAYEVAGLRLQAWH